MTRKYLALTTLATLLTFTTPVLAQTASPSGTLRDSVKQQVEAELADIKKGVAKKAFVGNITTKDSNLLTITNLKNQTRSGSVTTDTTFKLANGKDGTIADIKVNDFGIFMGDVDSKNNMTIKRILILTPPATDKRVTIVGTVTKSQPNTLTLQTLPAKDTFTVKVSSATKYTGTTKYADIKLDTKIVVVGKQDSSSVTASVIQVVE